MINKVVGYGGFKSYQQYPYPTKKQGKELQQTNNIWADTKREVDKLNTLDNFNHYHTLYKKSHVQNTQPKDYHPEHVIKGSHSTLNFKSNSLSNAYDAKQAKIAGEPDYRKGINLLKSGTQHWKTNYQAQLGDPAKTGDASKTNTKFSTMRSNSTGKMLNNNNLIDEQMNKAKSYKNRAYINNSKTGVSDYKFNYGQKIGANPLQILSQDSSAQPIRDHPLKYGTNQLWTQIPGYQGFKPSELHFQQLKSKIQGRNNKQKIDRKVNIMQNYNVKIPGYGGYKPKFNVQTNQLRDSCFGTK